MAYASKATRPSQITTHAYAHTHTHAHNPPYQWLEATRTKNRSIDQSIIVEIKIEVPVAICACNKGSKLSLFMPANVSSKGHGHLVDCVREMGECVI